MNQNTNVKIDKKIRRSNETSGDRGGECVLWVCVPMEGNVYSARILPEIDNACFRNEFGSIIGQCTIRKTFFANCRIFGIVMKWWAAPWPVPVRDCTHTYGRSHRPRQPVHTHYVWFHSMIFAKIARLERSTRYFETTCARAITLPALLPILSQAAANVIRVYHCRRATRLPPVDVRRTGERGLHTVSFLDSSELFKHFRFSAAKPARFAQSTEHSIVRIGVHVPSARHTQISSASCRKSVRSAISSPEIATIISGCYGNYYHSA